MSQRDAQWLTAALLVAEQSTGVHRHGAVVVVGNRIVGRGWNKVHPPSVRGAVPWHLKWRHAEAMAILDAGGEAAGAVLYVARLAAAGPALSEPCGRCRKLIARRGLRRAVWT